MDVKKLFEEMLEESRVLLNEGVDLANKGADYAAEQMGAPEGDANHELYRRLATGAAIASAVAVGLGTSTGRDLLKIGGLTALGAVAYRAYRKTQGSSTGPEDLDAAGMVGDADGEEARRRSQTLLRAMIAAARADGEVDAAERAIIEEKLQVLGDDAHKFFLDEMMKPVNIASIVDEARTDQERREIFAMSALVIRSGVAGAADRAFLDQMTQALGLGPSLATEIEREVAAAM